MPVGQSVETPVKFGSQAFTAKALDSLPKLLQLPTNDAIRKWRSAEFNLDRYCYVKKQ
jgi:hypothetical protein